MASVQITSRRQAEDMLISKAQQDESFRKELVANPRAAIGRQLGITLPAELDIKVVEETARSLSSYCRRRRARESSLQRNWRPLPEATRRRRKWATSRAASGSSVRSLGPQSLYSRNNRDQTRRRRRSVIQLSSLGAGRARQGSENLASVCNDARAADQAQNQSVEGRHRKPQRPAKVDEQDDTPAVGVVDHLVLEGIVEDQSGAFSPMRPLTTDADTTAFARLRHNQTKVQAQHTVVGPTMRRNSLSWFQDGEKGGLDAGNLTEELARLGTETTVAVDRLSQQQ